MLFRRWASRPSCFAAASAVSARKDSPDEARRLLAHFEAGSRAMMAAPMATKGLPVPEASTCRKALKWLDGQGRPYDKTDLVATPPSLPR